MAKHEPWHSRKEGVHHDNSDCGMGNHLHHSRPGTGGKPLCIECRRLAREALLEHEA